MVYKTMKRILACYARSVRIRRTFQTSMKHFHQTLLQQREREDAKSLGGRILRYEDEAQIRWPIPWIPPNPSIPRVFTPTGRGRRTSRKQQIPKAISRTRSLNSIVSRR